MRDYGFLGIIVLGVLLLFYLFFISSAVKAAQDKIEEWWKSLPIFRAAPLPPAEIQRREVDYLQGLEQSPALQPPDEMAVKLDVYLASLRDRENPLKPSEEIVYVPLEGGLGADISPRIGLFRGGQPEERMSAWQWVRARVFGRMEPVEAGKMFAEQKTFKDLAEAMEAVDEDAQAPYPVLALLGEPGAGKSTILRKFARDMVRKRLADPAALLPFFVSLSAHKNGSPLTYLRGEWKRMLGFDGLDDALAAGRIWLFADGLNEMPRAMYESRKAQWRAFLREHFLPNGNRALVACRVADYGEGIGAPRLVIHGMDDDRIQSFLRKRIPDRAAVLWQELERDKEESGAIYQLVQIPFWLVMLTRVSGKTGLPRNRAGLLDDFIRQWLDYENGRDGGRILNDIQRQAFMDGLTRLAWEGLSRSQNYTFRLKEACRIVSAGQSVVSGQNLLGLGQDCSLLTCESETVRFQHQLLQEFFAARRLARQFVDGQNLRGKWRVPWRRWKFVRSRWDPLPPPPLTGWEEAVILAAGLLDAAQAEKLALSVLSDTPSLAARCVLESGVAVSPEMQRKTRERLRLDLQSARQRLPARLTAGKALAKMGDPRLLERSHEFAGANGKTIRYIEPDWIDVPEGVFTMGTSPSERLRIQLQRFAVEQDELPPHKVYTGAFRMGRFPVTVVEYRCFMDAGGYEDDAFWQAPGALRWRNASLPYEESYAYTYIRTLRENQEQFLKQVDEWEKRGAWSPAQAENVRRQMRMDDNALRRQWERNEAQKRDASGRIVRPWGWENSDLAVDNQPVVGIAWYEACAYAAWLDGVLRAQERLAGEVYLRLPTEAEWEKAARSGQPGLWAWGSRWSADRANTLEGRVMKPTPVGAYPRGASGLGLQDMNGNVWEWCSDWYAGNMYKTRAGKIAKDPPGADTGDARVLRGGSWRGSRDDARCAARGRSVPDHFLSNVGFRLACSPSTSER
jgi:formylglycine-generating enzyme required for sulfatase activity